MSESRKKQLKDCFSSVDESERRLIDKLIDEVCYLEDRMDEVRKMPFIQVHPTNKFKQRKTEAAKLYKELSQSYMNAIRILISSLRKVEGDEMNELLETLKDYEL